MMETARRDAATHDPSMIDAHPDLAHPPESKSMYLWNSFLLSKFYRCLRPPSLDDAAAASVSPPSDEPETEEQELARLAAAAARDEAEDRSLPHTSITTPGSPASATAYLNPAFRWSLHLTHGYFVQTNLSVFGNVITLSLLARRSRFFAGTRYLKRGLNTSGQVANDVEVEQVVGVRSGPAADHLEGSLTSYVQVRASIPLFWSQESHPITFQPAIVVARTDPIHQATRSHIVDLFQRYGSPLLLLNLVKHEEKVTPERRRESILGSALAECVAFLNSFIGDAEHRIDYHAWDFKRVSQSKHRSLVDELGIISQWSLIRTGFFHSRPHPEAFPTSALGTKDVRPKKESIVKWINRMNGKEEAGENDGNVSSSSSTLTTSTNTASRHWSSLAPRRRSKRPSSSSSPLYFDSSTHHRHSALSPPRHRRWHFWQLEKEVSATMEAYVDTHKGSAMIHADTKQKMQLMQHAFTGSVQRLLPPAAVTSTSSLPFSLPPFPTRHIGFLQRGVVRTNCIDSLDRTNVAQFCIGKAALGYQLFALGLIDQAQLDAIGGVPVECSSTGHTSITSSTASLSSASSEVVNLLLDLYEGLGDVLSNQYGGSAMHRSLTSRPEKDASGRITGQRTLQTSSRSSKLQPSEVLVSIRRHIQNSFQDNGKQEAINLFLGYYVPMQPMVGAEMMVGGMSVGLENSSSSGYNSRSLSRVPSTSTFVHSRHGSFAVVPSPRSSSPFTVAGSGNVSGTSTSTDVSQQQQPHGYMLPHIWDLASDFFLHNPPRPLMPAWVHHQMHAQAVQAIIQETEKAKRQHQKQSKKIKALTGEKDVPEISETDSSQAVTASTTIVEESAVEILSETTIENGDMEASVVTHTNVDTNEKAEDTPCDEGDDEVSQLIPVSTVLGVGPTHSRAGSDSVPGFGATSLALPLSLHREFEHNLELGRLLYSDESWYRDAIRKFEQGLHGFIPEWLMSVPPKKRVDDADADDNAEGIDNVPEDHRPICAILAMKAAKSAQQILHQPSTAAPVPTNQDGEGEPPTESSETRVHSTDYYSNAHDGSSLSSFDDLLATDVHKPRHMRSLSSDIPTPLAASTAGGGGGGGYSSLIPRFLWRRNKAEDEELDEEGEEEEAKIPQSNTTNVVDGTTGSAAGAKLPTPITHWHANSGTASNGPSTQTPTRHGRAPSQSQSSPRQVRPYGAGFGASPNVASSRSVDEDVDSDLDDEQNPGQEPSSVFNLHHNRTNTGVIASAVPCSPPSSSSNPGLLFQVPATDRIAALATYYAYTHAPNLPYSAALSLAQRIILTSTVRPSAATSTPPPPPAPPAPPSSPPPLPPKGVASPIARTRPISPTNALVPSCTPVTSSTHTATPSLPSTSYISLPLLPALDSSVSLPSVDEKLLRRSLQHYAHLPVEYNLIVEPLQQQMLIQQQQLHSRTTASHQAESADRERRSVFPPALPPKLRKPSTLSHPANGHGRAPSASASPAPDTRSTTPLLAPPPPHVPDTDADEDATKSPDVGNDSATIQGQDAQAPSPTEATASPNEPQKQNGGEDDQSTNTLVDANGTYVPHPSSLNTGSDVASASENRLISPAPTAHGNSTLDSLGQAPRGAAGMLRESARSVATVSDQPRPLTTPPLAAANNTIGKSSAVASSSSSSSSSPLLSSSIAPPPPPPSYALSSSNVLHPTISSHSSIPTFTHAPVSSFIAQANLRRAEFYSSYLSRANFDQHQHFLHASFELARAGQGSNEPIVIELEEEERTRQTYAQYLAVEAYGN